MTGDSGLLTVQQGEATEISDTTRLGTATATAALGLGLMGNLLMRSGHLGLNGLLWVAAVLAALLVLRRRGMVPLEGEGRWLLLPAVLCAAAYIWRASPALSLTATVGLLVSLVLIMSTAREGRVRVAGLADYAWSGILAVVMGLVGPLFLLAGDIKWNELRRLRWSAKAGAVVKGLIIAVPLLLIFGGLLAAADAVFERLVADAIDFDLGNLISHVVLTGFFAWLAASFLRQTLIGKPIPLPQEGRPSALYLGSIETGIVLGSLNVLFLAFVVVQFRYFFGGAALVEASIGLTHAEYARRGFFELVGVSALVLPMLLFAHWLQPEENRVYRWLAGVMVALLFVMMLSALQRMRLYQQEFGLTELRLYTTVFMLWLGALLMWFGVTVLRGLRERFAFGALVTGLVVVLGLQVLNPDAFIVRTNLRRMAEGKRFDAAYAASLSADVVPMLIEALPEMGEAERAAVAQSLLSRWDSPVRRPDWRSWNWSRARAARLVAENRASLRAAVGE